MSNNKIFWQEYLRGFLAPTPVGYSQACRSEGAGRGSRGQLGISLTLETTRNLKTLLKDEDFDLDLVIQGAWAILLSKYSGNDDVIYGVENLCGDTGLLPFRIQVPSKMHLLPWFRQLNNQYNLLLANADIPLETIIDCSEIPDNTALFDSVIVLNNGNSNETSNDSDRIVARYPFMLYPANGNVLEVIAEYSEEFMSDRAAGTILGHLETVLEEMKNQPDGYLGTLPILAPEEKKLLYEWNDTVTPLPRENTIAEMFQAQVERTPDQVAGVFEDRQITYRELDERANHLARRLRAMGVVPEVRVGVCMERSLEMLVGLLGILKAGGAYVPLDPTFPRERLAFMLSDSQIPILLMDEELSERLPANGAKTVLLNKQKSSETDRLARGIESRLSGDNLAYVIYTSGSTGIPKGVMVEQRNVVNFFVGMDRVVDHSPGDTLLAVTSLSFDISVLELLWALTCGFKVIICPDSMTDCSESKNSPYSIPNLVREHHVTHFQCTPTMAGILMLDEETRSVFTQFRQILIGGEAFPVSLAENLKKVTTGNVINMYGPTETTVWSTTHRLGKLSPRISIGRPIANTTVLIVDKNLQPVPIGIPGELIIGGKGVVRGYLNRPELTAERFIQDPIDGEFKGRYYRTGDLAKYLPDGNLEFLGRIDHQVKIRGFRIELGEIEAHLHECPEIHDAVVIDREDVPGHRNLVAYVILREGQVFSRSRLRNYLNKRLPEYMIPAHFIVLKEFPQTPNKKIDRKALPPPETDLSGKDIESDPPVTDIEKAITGIWEEALNIKGIGRKDSFFEIGGDSLLACSVTFSIEEACGVEVPLDTIFGVPTVEAFANKLEEIFLEQQQGEKHTPLKDKDTAEMETSADLSLSEMETTLSRIWAKILNVDTVHPEDSFFRMGGDSLKAVALFIEIEKSFGIKLPISALIKAPSVKDLVKVLCEEKADMHWSPLVPIQPLGSKLPFFCVHAHRGNVMNYYDLSKYLGTDQPFYGLQARGLDGSETEFRTFEEIAADYLADVRSVQPTGPYYIGGWCMGGCIALEMARILQAEGEKVSLLALIDSPHPAWPEYLPYVTGGHKAIYKAIERVHFEVRSCLALNGKEKYFYIQRKVKALMFLFRFMAEKIMNPVFRRIRRISQNAKLYKLQYLSKLCEKAFKSNKPGSYFQYSMLYDLQHLYALHEKAFESYKPDPYGGRAIIFSPDIKPLGTVKDYRLGWGSLLADDVELCEIPGHWINILAEPGIKVLANELKNRLS